MSAGAVDVRQLSAERIARANSIQWRSAVRRRALKRWLRAHGVSYRERDMYNETALRKLVRDHSQEARRHAD